MVAAGFSGGEADHLRRAMASWGKNGDLEQFREKLIHGMQERGHSLDFSERLFKQIKGFGSYGFPESHAASFCLIGIHILLAKVSSPSGILCWLTQ